MRHVLLIAIFTLLLASCPKAGAQLADSAARSVSEEYSLRGKVVAASGAEVSGAEVRTAKVRATTDSHGNFELQVAGGSQQISISADGYAPLSVPISVTQNADLKFEMQPAAALIVTAQSDDSARDSTEQIHDAADLIQSNVGQPGVPVRLPGLPTETASGGVKAPQYFAPGVAGDHGEPIAQYIQVGDFQFPNNLPANAHGNGYADPNLLIANAVGFVESDPGAFDVRHGNNAVDLAVGYGLVPQWQPFVQVSADSHNYDFVSGLGPKNEQTAGWLGFEVAGGNGFLNFPEHRRQYKINGERAFTLGRHTLTVFGAGYAGQSRIPGLVPIDVRVSNDTIDPRQSDRTHTELIVGSDSWTINEQQALTFSGYFRSYGLDLRSNFGDGLIRQSEFRTVTGGNTSYTNRLSSRIAFTSGVDFRRDAPRNSELAHADSNGTLDSTTRNDFTISDLAPYANIYGSVLRMFRYNVGVRRDDIFFVNSDLISPSDSYHSQAGLTSPRGAVSFRLPRRSLPTIAFSSGEAFHTNDPRIGLGSGRGTPIAKSHASQLVATENAFGSQFRVALSRVTNSAELGRIDADTGLQENLGPSLIKSATFSAQRRFSFAFLQATFARAQATDLLTMQDVPEAPRAIYDFSATSIRLPWHLQVSTGFEYVGVKPLGDGFRSVPVREIRGSFTRSFNNGIDAGLHFLAASGYTGQTVETLQLPNENAPFERVVGVRQASYVGLSLKYRFARR